MATLGKTNQFDNYQLDPNTLGDDWVFSGDEVHLNRAPKAKISNYNYYFAGTRRANDRTLTTLGSPDPNINPTREITWAGGLPDSWLGHGVDWAEFNYNPYGRQDVWNSTWSQNPNFRVKNDWLKITGMGGIGVPTEDVMDLKEANASGMLQYRNYPTEGYNSYGKQTARGSGDKRWRFQGNTWVPAP